MRESIIKDRSKAFALSIIGLYRYLTMESDCREYVLSKQLLRSGTSIGANVKEALRGQSRADFSAKMNIALKEASESEYWIELLIESNFISGDAAESILQDCREIIKMLFSIVKTCRETLNPKL